MNKFLEKIKVDMWIFTPLILLSLMGMLVLYSASNQSVSIVSSQLFKLILGFSIMIIVSQVNPIKIRVWSPKFYFIILFLLICVPLFGHTAMGAKRWLNLGFMNIQPSELMKLALPMMLGWLIYKRGMPKYLKTSILYSFLIIIPVGLVLRQPDLGTSILILLSGLFLLFQAGLSYSFILLSITLMVSSSPFLWYLLKDYQQQRIISLFDAESDPLGSGYHIIQSKTAISSGGFSGKGYLEGTQSHLGFIPEQKTDFIFAVFSEEFGFKGFFILMCLYSVLIFRLIKIILESKDMYQKLVTGSILMVFVSYIFVNIGMVSGMLPVVGVPLPMISFGGTSVLSLMIGFGVASSFSTHRSTQKIR
jgi:rod shape determining protein RodA